MRSFETFSEREKHRVLQVLGFRITLKQKPYALGPKDITSCSDGNDSESDDCLEFKEICRLKSVEQYVNGIPTGVQRTILSGMVESIREELERKADVLHPASAKRSSNMIQTTLVLSPVNKTESKLSIFLCF